MKAYDILNSKVPPYEFWFIKSCEAGGHSMTENEMLQAIYLDMQDMKTDIQDMKTDIRDLKSRVSGIEMTLENETNRNIRIIAEGHADLCRKLDEALKVENEKELLLVRTNIMENDIRKIKDKLEIA